MQSDPFTNPYKFRLWFGKWSPGIFSARQTALVLHFLNYGKSGCDSWNYKIADLFRISIRTLQRDLRILEHYQIIQIAGALGKYRKIRVLPCSKKRIFFMWGFKQMVKKWGDKFVTHQRRYYKDYSNNKKQEILYGPIGLEIKGTGLPPAAQTYLQKQFVEKFLKMGYNRTRAINLAGIKIERRFSKK